MKDTSIRSPFHTFCEQIAVLLVLCFGWIPKYRQLILGSIGVVLGLYLALGLMCMFFYIFAPGATIGESSMWINWWWAWLR